MQTDPAVTKVIFHTATACAYSDGGAIQARTEDSDWEQEQKHFCLLLWDSVAS